MLNYLFNKKAHCPGSNFELLLASLVSAVFHNFKVLRLRKIPLSITIPLSKSLEQPLVSAVFHNFKVLWLWKVPLLMKIPLSKSLEQPLVSAVFDNFQVLWLWNVPLLIKISLWKSMEWCPCVVGMMFCFSGSSNFPDVATRAVAEYEVSYFIFLISAVHEELIKSFC